MCGLIKTMNFAELTNDTENGIKYDRVYAIVRSMKAPMTGVEQLAALSPSDSLFSGYLNLKNRGDWNQERFETWYRPIFEEEMRTSAEAQRVLTQLASASKAGQRIALICFCSNRFTCHRRIVAELLGDRGANVIFR